MLTLFKKYFWPAFCGALSGVAWQLDRVAIRLDPQYLTYAGLMAESAAVGLAFASVFFFSRWLTVRKVEQPQFHPGLRIKWLRSDALVYTVLLLPCLGAFGLRFDATGLLLTVITFTLLKVRVAWRYQPEKQFHLQNSNNLWLPVVFLFSGFSALVYQVVWQRYLLVILGVNIESVTLVVSLFMLGLGAGALAGGYLSLRMLSRQSLLLTFVCCELVIGLFGFLSSHYFLFIQKHVALSVVALTTYALAFLLVPTLFMGATLPLLVSYLKKSNLTVGESVGWLYFASTLGSALACFVTVHILFLWLGLHTTAAIAAGINLLVVCLVFCRCRGDKLPLSREACHAR